MTPDEGMGNAEVPLMDAKLRLPSGTDLDGLDRVVVTKLNGETLAAAYVFYLIGNPQVLQTGIILNLKLSTT